MKFFLLTVLALAAINSISAFAKKPSPEELETRIIFKEEIDYPEVFKLKLKDFYNFHKYDNVKIWFDNFMDGESYFLHIDFKMRGKGLMRITYDFDSLTYEGKPAFVLNSARVQNQEKLDEYQLGIYEVYTPIHQYLDSVQKGLTTAKRAAKIDEGFLNFFRSFQKDIIDNNKIALADKIDEASQNAQEKEIYVKYYNPEMPVFGTDRKLFLGAKPEDFEHFTAEVYGFEMDGLPKNSEFWICNIEGNNLIFTKKKGKFLFLTSMIDM